MLWICLQRSRSDADYTREEASEKVIASSSDVIVVILNASAAY